MWKHFAPIGPSNWSIQVLLEVSLPISDNIEVTTIIYRASVRRDDGHTHTHKYKMIYKKWIKDTYMKR